MATVPVTGGFDIAISKARVDADDLDDLDDMLVEMAKLIMKYQRKKP